MPMKNALLVSLLILDVSLVVFELTSKINKLTNKTFFIGIWIQWKKSSFLVVTRYNYFLTKISLNFSIFRYFSFCFTLQPPNIFHKFTSFYTFWIFLRILLHIDWQKVFHPFQNIENFLIFPISVIFRLKILYYSYILQRSLPFCHGHLSFCHLWFSFARSNYFSCYLPIIITFWQKFR